MKPFDDYHEGCLHDSAQIERAAMLDESTVPGW